MRLQGWTVVKKEREQTLTEVRLWRRQIPDSARIQKLADAHGRSAVVTHTTVTPVPRLANPARLNKS